MRHIGEQAKTILDEATGQPVEGSSNIFKPETLDEKTCERCKKHIRFMRFYDRYSSTPGVKEAWEQCDCAVLDYMEQQQAAARQAKHEKMMAQKLRVFDSRSLVNGKIKNASFKTFVTDNETFKAAAKNLHHFVKQWEPGSVLLYGSYGTGKSHLAYSASKMALAAGKTSLFISVPMLLTKIKETFNRKSETTEAELIEYLIEVDLLVLDDIGAEGAGEQWAQDKLFLILDGRQGKRTIYTTNLDGAELESKIGGRNYDRMAESLKVFTMVGESYRRNQKPTW